MVKRISEFWSWVERVSRTRSLVKLVSKLGVIGQTGQYVKGHWSNESTNLDGVICVVIRDPLIHDQSIKFKNNTRAVGERTSRPRDEVWIQSPDYYQNLVRTFSSNDTSTVKFS